MLNVIPLKTTKPNLSVLGGMNYYSDTYSKQIHIKTQIRKTFILALATNEFL